MAIRLEITERSGVMGRVFGRETVVHQEFLEPGRVVALAREHGGATEVILLTAQDANTATATTNRFGHGLSLPRTEERVLEGREINLRSSRKRVSFVPQEP